MAERGGRSSGLNVGTLSLPVRRLAIGDMGSSIATGAALSRARSGEAASRSADAVMDAAAEAPGDMEIDIAWCSFTGGLRRPHRRRPPPVPLCLEWEWR